MDFNIWLTLLAVVALSHCDEDAECNFRGSLIESSCRCNAPYFGANCEIVDLNANDEEACKERPDAAVCSGQGSCISGFCECNQRDNFEEEISGRFCECSNFLCPHYNGLLCGGPDHGECICNECVCRPGWSGESCECTTENHNCKYPGSQEICSNNGRCECDQCICEGGYSGHFCQECPTCRGSCVELRSCVYCQSFGGRQCPMNHDEYAEKCHLEIEMVDRLGEIREDERLCTFFDGDDCRTQFAYSTWGRSWKIRSSWHRECPRTLEPESVAEGRYKCSRGQQHTVSSYMKREMTAGKRYTWTFQAYEGKKAAIKCPFISIPENESCRRDGLIISSPSEHKNARKICGDVREFLYSSNEGIKVSFKRSVSSAQFACAVVCDGDTLIQQPSPEETRSVSKTHPVVNSCADTDPQLLRECKCFDCDGHISLHCSLCYKESIDAFENYDFRVDIELELTMVCRSHLDLAGSFGPNARRIKYLKLCIHDTISIAFIELENLEAFAIQDCHKSAFSICQIKPLEESAQPLISALRLGARPSVEIVGVPVQIPNAEEVLKLNQLIMTNVNVTVDDRLLDFPNLRKIVLSSDGGLTVTPKAFDRLPYLEVLSVKSCMNVFESESFKFTSPFLKEVRIEDKCVHSIASRAIAIDSSGRLESFSDRGSKIKLYFSLNEKYFDHIPMCPFRPMIEMKFAEVVWESGLECRSCGGIWYWDLTLSHYNGLAASCFDSVSESTMSVQNYVAHNEKLCSFQTGYLGTCI